MFERYYIHGGTNTESILCIYGFNEDDVDRQTEFRTYVTHAEIIYGVDKSWVGEEEEIEWVPNGSIFTSHKLVKEIFENV